MTTIKNLTLTTSLIFSLSNYSFLGFNCGNSRQNADQAEIMAQKFNDLTNENNRLKYDHESLCNLLTNAKTTNESLIKENKLQQQALIAFAAITTAYALYNTGKLAHNLYQKYKKNKLEK